MNRLWSRVSVRVISVGLLVLGIVGGVYLGQGRATQQRGAEAQLVVQADADEMQLLKARQSQHAAARAWQREAQGNAAAKAAAEAKAAASKAHQIEKKAIDKKLAAKAEAEAAAAAEKAKKEESGSTSSGGASKPYDGPIPASCAEFSGNRKIGCAVMLDSGFGIDQFPCLDGLYDRESGWNERAENTGSGAYGIPQALPGDKMASAGSDWQTNPATQVTWGLGYIKDRYGTPCDAKAHSDANGWY